MLTTLRTAACLTVGVCGALTLCYKYRENITTFLLDRCSVSINGAAGLRDSYFDTDIKCKPCTSVKAHAASAALRTGFGSFADRVAAAAGMDTWHYQISKRDVQAGRKGAVIYRWPSDTTCPYREDDDNGHMRVIVDVDYYLDMPRLLVERPQPTMLYTFVPEHAAYVGEDYCYTFDTNGEVVVNYAGGSKYQHKLWDYNHDVIMVSNSNTVVVYQVDCRRVGPDRLAILLTPVRVWRGFWAFLARFTLDARPLQRMNCVSEGFAVLWYMAEGKAKLSLARCLQHNCMTTDKATFDCFRVLSRTSHVNTNLATFSSYLDGDKKAASAALDYFKSVEKDPPCPHVVHPDDAVNRYQFVPRHYDCHAKPTMIAYMSPLMNGAYAPDKTMENEKAAVEGRVLKVRHGKAASPALAEKMREFAALLIPNPHIHHPVDYDEIWDRQARPSQRQLVSQAVASGPWYKTVVKSFMKAETYDEPKDPRIISSIVPQDKVEWARYMYAFSNILKQTTWYAGGKTPKEIANIVSQICERARSHVDPGDYSRFDGTVGAPARELERVIMLRAFAKEHHDEIVRLSKTQHHNMSYMMLGYAFLTEWERLSGSAETSDFNSTLNAFVSYATWRFADPSLTPEECYALLGVFLGDDSLNPDIPTDVYKSVADQMGLILKSNPIERGKGGVNFLARLYTSEVWYGNPTSMCDLRRQLSKVHTVTAAKRDMAPLDALRNKAMAFSRTDSNTPVIGALCRKVMSLTDEEEFRFDPSIMSWFSQWDIEAQFPNEYHHEFMDMALKQIPSLDMTRFDEWLNQVEVAEELLHPPLIAFEDMPLVKAPVVVNGTPLRPPVPSRVGRKRL